MVISILNGDMNPDTTGFTQAVAKLVKHLENQHTIYNFNLLEKKIYSCHGCFHCWVKTPGICILKDEASEIHRAVINSDLIIFASPLQVGFTSSVLKKITDRLIVLLHPYIELKQGEMHHQKRYKKYPDFGLLLKKEEDTDDLDIKIIKDIYDRIAINFHSKVQFLEFVDDDQHPTHIDRVVNHKIVKK